MSHAVEVSAPGPDEISRIVRVLAEAFVDDPVWIAIGPRLRRHRRWANRVSFWGTVRPSYRHGARIRAARLDGRIVAATIAFPPGRWPLPDASAGWQVPWLIAAGPLPSARGIRIDQRMRKTHPTMPHMYLWYIGVEPGLQGRGIGRELMSELHADSDAQGLPTYLETGTPSNVAFYESLGYAVIGEFDVPGGDRMWRMLRPAGEAA